MQQELDPLFDQRAAGQQWAGGDWGYLRHIRFSLQVYDQWDQ